MLEYYADFKVVYGDDSLDDDWFIEDKMVDRFVMVIWGNMEHVKRQPFYQPCVLKDNMIFSLVNVEDMPTAWGYETPEEARQIILDIEAKEAQDEVEANYSAYHGFYKEDFHSDG